jgi:hypothetical protein
MSAGERAAHRTIGAKGVGPSAAAYGTTLALVPAAKAHKEGTAMYVKLIPFVAASSLALGCGASYPPPTQKLADTESAERSAAELGAATQPKAQLHLQLAQEQVVQAKAAILEGNNERATSLLSRAQSDAELAVVLTKEETAKGEAQKATDQSNTQRDTNAKQPGGQR